MDLQTGLNAVGLFLITAGGIGAALCSPTVQYNFDGSVSTSGQNDKRARIRMAWRQRALPVLLGTVGFGAFLQMCALFVDPPGKVATPVSAPTMQSTK